MKVDGPKGQGKASIERMGIYSRLMLMPEQFNGACFGTGRCKANGSVYFLAAYLLACFKF